jgi:hypothetical protein
VNAIFKGYNEVAPTLANLDPVLIG